MTTERLPHAGEAPPLGEAIWIGGSPCSGKSTVAAILARQLHRYCYTCDDAFERHADLVTATAGPTFKKVTQLSLEDRLAQPVDLQVADVFRLCREQFPLVVADLAANAGLVNRDTPGSAGRDGAGSDRPAYLADAGLGNAGLGSAGLGNAGLGNAGLGNAGLGNAGPVSAGAAERVAGADGWIVEGAALLPDQLIDLGVSREQAVFIIPTPGFQRQRYAERGWARDLLNDLRSPEQAFERWMLRDERFATELAGQARDNGFRVEVVDGSRTVEQLATAVAARARTARH